MQVAADVPAQVLDIAIEDGGRMGQRRRRFGAGVRLAQQLT
jgi:hypothetical protein